MTMWKYFPITRHIYEWCWVRSHVYPSGYMPWRNLFSRTIRWHWRRFTKTLDQPTIIHLPYRPEIEILVTSLRHEYPLFVYHTPLYEAEFFLLPALVQPDMIALNIGAHIGVYTLALAQLLPKGHVYSFEPMLETYQHLRLNIAWNQLRGLIPENVTAYRLAFGDIDGETKLFLESSTMQASLLAQQPLQPYEYVPAARLDTWLKQHSIDSVDLIVIDVEGAEDIVLRHAITLFQQPRQPLILCELNRKFGRQEAIWELLSQFGYRFWRYHSLRNCIEPVSNPYESAIYIHQTHLVHRGYGNVIAAPITWTPPPSPVISLSESHSSI